MVDGIAPIGFAEYHHKRRDTQYDDPGSDIQTFRDKGLMARIVGVLADAQDDVEEAPDMAVLTAILDKVRGRIQRMASRHEEYDYQRAMTLSAHFETDALTWFRAEREWQEVQQAGLPN